MKPAPNTRPAGLDATFWLPLASREWAHWHTGTLATMTLLKGTLDVLVLKALSWTPRHGFEITCWLEERSGGHLNVDDAALFQALHRMEERGLITAEWGVTENNRRARYYSMTAKGRSYLKAQAAELTQYAQVVTTILAARSARP